MYWRALNGNPNILKLLRLLRMPRLLRTFGFVRLEVMILHPSMDLSDGRRLRVVLDELAESLCECPKPFLSPICVVVQSRRR